MSEVPWMLVATLLQPVSCNRSQTTPMGLLTPPNPPAFSSEKFGSAHKTTCFRRKSRDWRHARQTSPLSAWWRGVAEKLRLKVAPLFRQAITRMFTIPPKWNFGILLIKGILSLPFSVKKEEKCIIWGLYIVWDKNSLR